MTTSPRIGKFHGNPVTKAGNLAPGSMVFKPGAKNHDRFNVGTKGSHTSKKETDNDRR